MNCRFLGRILATLVLGGMWVQGVADAALITGWGAETGFTNGTVTDNGGGSVTPSNPTGNLGVRALLPSTFSLPNVGDAVRFSGDFVSSKASGEFGNQQFRFGLFNTNGNAVGTLGSGVWTGAVPSGWLGYIVQAGNNPGATSLFGRAGSGGNAWLSTSGAGYQVNNTVFPAVDPLPGTYVMSMLIERTSATALSISYNFTQTVGGSYTTSGTFTDSGGASATIGATQYNAFGIFLNGNTGGGTFTNMDVSYVPEPASAMLLLVALVGLGSFRSAQRRV